MDRASRGSLHGFFAGLLPGFVSTMLKLGARSSLDIFQIRTHSMS